MLNLYLSTVLEKKYTIVWQLFSQLNYNYKNSSQKLPLVAHFQMWQITEGERPAALWRRAAAAGNKGVIWCFIHQISNAAQSLTAI